MPDSRRISRRLAALGLVAGPVLLLVDALMDPAWSSNDAVYLAEVAHNKTTNIVSESIATAGALVLVAGALGIMRLMRGPRLTLGQVAAAILTIGLIGLTASLAFNAFDIAMADFSDRRAMIAFHHDLEHSAAYNLYWIVFFYCGVVLGSLLVAIALLRRPIVPRWSPALLIAAVGLWSIEGGRQALNALSLALLTIALLPLGARIWSLSDDEWEQWVVPLDATPRPAAGRRSR